MKINSLTINFFFPIWLSLAVWWAFTGRVSWELLIIILLSHASLEKTFRW